MLAPDAARADAVAASDTSTITDAPVVGNDGAGPRDDAAIDAATGMDVTAPTDAPIAAQDVVADRTVANDTAAPSCALPLGGTCPAGTTCPAGDGCNRCSCPASGGVANCTRIACPPDAGAPSDAGAACRTAADCRMFESYCSTDPCSCIALSSAEPDPRCDGRAVTCFVPPCRGQSVDCVAGRCVLGASM